MTLRVRGDCTPRVRGRLTLTVRGTDTEGAECGSRAFPGRRQGCRVASDLERREGEDSKSGPEAFRSRSAQIRHGLPIQLGTEVILYRTPENPSRARIVRTRDGGPDFPRQRSGSRDPASLPTRSGTPTAGPPAAT